MRLIFAVLSVALIAGDCSTNADDTSIKARAEPGSRVQSDSFLSNFDSNFRIFPEFDSSHQNLDVDTAESQADPSIDDHYSYISETGDEYDDLDTSRKSRVKPHSEVTDTGSSDDHHSFVSESESDHKQDFESKINDVRNINVKDDTQDLGNATYIEKTRCQNVASSFSLLLQPKTVTAEQNSDVQLSCQLLPHDETIQIPPFLLSWVFKSVDCLTEKQANQSCEQMLQTTAFNGSDHDFIAEYNIYQLSDNQTGKYVCIAEITECVDEEDYTSTHQSVNLRVYTKPDYTTHLAGIAVLMILTLVLLFALIFFCRRIQRIQLQRYQELMSSTKIQFHPTKILELPNTAVYHPTTTSFDRRSTSSFDSKYSLSSQDEP